MNELYCPYCGEDENIEEIGSGDGYLHFHCNHCDQEFDWRV